jgi:hypothetical protein
MTGKTFAFATIAGAITSFIVGYLIYGVLMADFFANNAGSATGVMMEEPMMVGLVLGNVVYAAFLTLVLGSWAKVSSVGAGVKAGTLVGLLVGLSMNLIWYSTSNLATLTAHLVDAALFGVLAGITGAVIAVVVGKTYAAT